MYTEFAIVYIFFKINNEENVKNGKSDFNNIFELQIYL